GPGRAARGRRGSGPGPPPLRRRRAGREMTTTTPSADPDDDGGAPDQTLRVLVVDDQPLRRSGFAMMLGAEEDIEVAGDAADGAAALEACRRLDRKSVV